MRIAIISDIHGNLPALEAALERITTLGPEKIFCLGDIVGYGPFPNECVALVRARCTEVVRGNHDSGLIGETSIEDFNQYGQRALKWTSGVISEENLGFLRGLPYTITLEGLTLVHASPADPPAWTYVHTMPSAREALEAFSTPFCFIGHTHVPIIIGDDYSVNTYRPPLPGSGSPRHLINVGSIGQPRDGDPRAAFGLIDTETNAYELVRVEYDIERTAGALLKAGLPDPLARRLFQGV